MSKKKGDLQPDLCYRDAEGKLHDDGLHEDILASEAGNAASAKASQEAAIKRGMSRALAEKLYGRD